MSALILVLVLALVQGLTEFLPVSSSGHLALIQILVGDKIDLGDMVALDLVLHLGTLVPVFWFYRADLMELVRGVRSKEGQDERRYVGFLLAATIPTGIIGLSFRSYFEEMFQSPIAVGIGLLITACLLTSSRFFDRNADAGFGQSLTAGLSVKVAVAIGLIQGLAVTPGISRSGSTIAMALFLGLPRANAARFSFLLSIPAILGAALLQISSSHDLRLVPSLVGFVVSALVGYGALWMLVRLVGQGRFWIFAPYVTALGLLALWFGL